MVERFRWIVGCHQGGFNWDGRANSHANRKMSSKIILQILCCFLIYSRKSKYFANPSTPQEFFCRVFGSVNNSIIKPKKCITIIFKVKEHLSHLTVWLSSARIEVTLPTLEVSRTGKLSNFATRGATVVACCGPDELSDSAVGGAGELGDSNAGGAVELQLLSTLETSRPGKLSEPAPKGAVNEREIVCSAELLSSQEATAKHSKLKFMTTTASVHYGVVEPNPGLLFPWIKNCSSTPEPDLNLLLRSWLSLHHHVVIFGKIT